jgi:hypothetical protein
MSTTPLRPSPGSLSAEAETETETGSDGLRRTLKRRHMNLIALGGVIGAGLFVGSGVVIHTTGPAAIVSFLIAGAIIVSVMRMLAEMAVARPAVGSFYAYAREALGPRAGFLVGWMYWYFFAHRRRTGPRGRRGLLTRAGAADVPLAHRHLIRTSRPGRPGPRRPTGVEAPYRRTS